MNRRMFKGITRTVVTLGWVSLFMDVASEMLYPVMPLLLPTLGFSFAAIGILEGGAEAVAGIGKIYFGRLSDRYQNKKFFVTTGYALSALSKLGLALIQTTSAVFSFRLADRVGKGVRTAPRDAILALETNDINAPSVFGFHRAMDTFGAFIGPTIAAAYLFYEPGDYFTLLWVAAVPGLLAVLLTLCVKEKHVAIKQTEKPSLNLLRVLSGTDIHTKSFFNAVVPFILFAVVNSSDVFLILLAKSRGLSDVNVLLLYVGYNLLYALAAYPAGLIAQRIGSRNAVAIGLVCFAVTYVGMLFCTNSFQFALAFAVYSLYAAFTESPMKAHINQFLPSQYKAAGLGFLAGWQSLGLLAASVWTGFLWEMKMVNEAFIISAVAAVVICIFILISSQTTR